MPAVVHLFRISRKKKEPSAAEARSPSYAFQVDESAGAAATGRTVQVLAARGTQRLRLTRVFPSRRADSYITILKA